MAAYSCRCAHCFFPGIWTQQYVAGVGIAKRIAGAVATFVQIMEQFGANVYLCFHACVAVLYLPVGAPLDDETDLVRTGEYDQLFSAIRTWRDVVLRMGFCALPLLRSGCQFADWCGHGAGSILFLPLVVPNAPTWTDGRSVEEINMDKTVQKLKINNFKYCFF